MSGLARVYRALFVANVQQAAQYRVQAVLWLLFAVVRPVVFLAAWSAAAGAQGGSIGDYSAADFAAYYVCLTLVSQLTLSWHMYDFELEVRQGKLAPKLLRPLHPLHYTVVENLVYKLTTLPPLAPALVLIAWTFGAHFQTQPVHLVLFVPSVLAAAALRFMFGWLLAAFAFWTTRTHAIVHLYDRVVFVFAGQIAPLSLLPAPLATLGYALPFGYMLWAPAEILRGGLPVDRAIWLVMAQCAWLLASCVTFVWVWRLGLRQFSAVGA
ncbi:MAG TPA: ABC-2 family transporter protein [Chloroflexota bacterium]